MSDTPTIAASSARRNGAEGVRGAIARAAQATGVDFSYLLAQAKLESGLDPSARAGTSSAAGLYQFTRSTWLETLDRHGAEHGLEWAGEAIQGGRVADAATRAQLLALRHDPDAASMMAAELAADNRAELAAVLGRDPAAAELYLGHFLGVGGARTFLAALASDPGRSAASVLPQAAAANRAIFYGAQGARSVGEVMSLVTDRMERAMQSGEGATWSSAAYAPPTYAAPMQGPLASEFQAARAELPKSPGRSMADTLAAAFGSRGASLPASVQGAYAKLARFGL